MDLSSIKKMHERELKLLTSKYEKRISALRTEQSMVELKMRERHTRIVNDILRMSSNGREQDKNTKFELKITNNPPDK